jgi:hypothetical protein
VLAGMVLVVLDAAIVNIALPAIATSLQVTPASAVQVITAYQLGLVMMLLRYCLLTANRRHWVLAARRTRNGLAGRTRSAIRNIFTISPDRR